MEKPWTGGIPDRDPQGFIRVFEAQIQPGRGRLDVDADVD
jgi:hypothetical protein